MAQANRPQTSRSSVAAPRSATSPISPASRSRRSPASSTTGPTSPPAPARGAAGRPRARLLHEPRGARAPSGRTGIVGLTLPLVDDAYFGPILSGASEALYEQDMRIMLRPTLHEHDREVSLLDRLMRGTTDGAILMLPEESTTSCSPAGTATRSSSSTRARRRPTASRASRRCTRGREARDRASARARPPAHRRVGGAPGWYANDERMIGFRAALAAAGLLPDPDLILQSDWQHPVRRERPRSSSRSPTRRPRSSGSTTTSRSARSTSPAAAACASRRTSRSSASTTRSRRRSSRPQLTTVRQPLAELGPHGRQPADAAHRGPAPRRAPHRARDDPGRP